MKITIICDKCGWNKQDQNFKDWLNKPCPECGYKMINKADIAMFRFLKIIKAISDIAVFFFPKLKTHDVYVSSAKAHKEYKKP